MTKVTDKILSEINSRNISITDFANDIGVSRDTVYNFSDDTIKYITVKKIAEVLNLPISFFINDEEEEEKRKGKKGMKKDVVNVLFQRQSKLLNELNIVAKELQKAMKKV